MQYSIFTPEQDGTLPSKQWLIDNDEVLCSNLEDAGLYSILCSYYKICECKKKNSRACENIIINGIKYKKTSWYHSYEPDLEQYA